MRYEYDLMVIGGGAAGLTAAGAAAYFGAKVALVEASKLGGDCTWCGCVPSKTLLKAAKVAHTVRTAEKCGLCNLPLEVDFPGVMQHVCETRERVYEDADAPEIYERLGVDVLSGRARFLEPHVVELHDPDGSTRKLSARKFVLATGSSPVVPPIAGLADTPFLTNETVFSLQELPKRLLVLGAGPIGVEMAQAFRRLGSEVVVVDLVDRILGNDDEELAALLKAQLEQEGVRFELGVQVTRVEKCGAGIRLTGQRGEEGRPVQVEGDALLLAVGRRANVEGLNLEAAGVRYDRTGIPVDERGRTNARHIYACGDVTGRFQFTHFAEHMAKVAVSNAILHVPLKLDSAHITWCTYTDPELAHVGSTEAALRSRGKRYEVYRFPFTKIDRAVTENETTGWIKVFARKLDGKIYGVSILGAHAGEMIGEYALALRHGLTLRNIADTLHPYPTFVLGNRRAADQWYVRKHSRKLVWLLQKLFGYRGRLPDTSDPHRIV